MDKKMNKLFDFQQINFFTDNSDVSATPHLIKALLDVLGKYGLIPTFGQEINAMTGEQKQVVTMMEPSQSYRIEFPGGLIAISAINLDNNIFADRSINILKDLKSIFPSKKANRLAYIQNKVFQGSPEYYKELYGKIFTYHSVDPFEWDSRIAIKKPLAAHNEIINSISSIRRGIFNLPLSNMAAFNPFSTGIDCIGFEMDTNTEVENGNIRFDLENCTSVLQELFKENNLLHQEVKRYTDK